MCRVIIFDLDGTLADDVEVHLEAWKRAMEELGRKVSQEELEAYRRSVGKSLKDILKDIYGEIDEDFYRRVREAKNRHFRELIGKVKPIVGREILEKLRERYKLALFTSTNKNTALLLLKTLGIDDLFDVIVTADDVKRAKPDPEGLLKALERSGCRDGIFVGDTKYDEETAHRAGMGFIHVKEFLKSWEGLMDEDI